MEFLSKFYISVKPDNESGLKLPVGVGVSNITGYYKFTDVIISFNAKERKFITLNGEEFKVESIDADIAEMFFKTDEEYLEKIENTVKRDISEARRCSAKIEMACNNMESKVTIARAIGELFSM